MWDTVIRKATDTVTRWKSIHAGVFYNVLACNVYILSLFSYVGQLVKLDKSVHKFLGYMERNMFVGPGGWLPPDFMSSLMLIGFPAQIRNLHASTFSAKVRVAVQTCDDYNKFSDDLLVNISNFLNREGAHEHPHYQWHMDALARNLADAHVEFQRQCNSGSDIASLVDRNGKKHKQIQRKIYDILLDQSRPWRKAKMLEQIRKRLSRFRFNLPLGLIINRAHNRLLASRGFKPAIVAVFHKSLLNAWPTARRLRTLANARLCKRCPLCKDGPDSLEHLGEHCCISFQIYRRFGVSHGDMQKFLALDADSLHRPFLLKKLKAMAVLFSVRSTLVHHPKNAPPLDVPHLVSVGCSLHS